MKSVVFTITAICNLHTVRPQAVDNVTAVCARVETRRPILGQEALEDLDFKQTLYGNADGDRKDLAGDIAAMANRRGGLVLIGVREDNGVAAALTPVALSDPEEDRMHQITAQLVAPYVDFSKMGDGATTRCWSRVKCARCESSASSFIVVKLDSPR